MLSEKAELAKFLGSVVVGGIITIFVQILRSNYQNRLDSAAAKKLTVEAANLEIQGETIGLKDRLAITGEIIGQLKEITDYAKELAKHLKEVRQQEEDCQQQVLKLREELRLARDEILRLTDRVREVEVQCRQALNNLESTYGISDIR